MKTKSINLRIQTNSNVILFGCDGYNVLGVLRQLVPFGLNVFIVCVGELTGCASKSRYWKNWVVVNSCEEGIRFLLNTYAHTSEKSIIIATGDAEASAIDLNASLLRPYYIISGTNKMGLLSFIQNKVNMVDVAKECGFNVPKSMNLLHNTDIRQWSSYPCVVKPSIWPKERPFQIKILNNKEDLLSFKSTITSGYEYILQAYVPKEIDVLLIGCRLTTGQCVLPGVYVKDRWKNARSGTGTHGKIFKEIPSFIDSSHVINFLEKIEYYGPFSVEYGVVKGKAYFYEINLRNDGTSNHFSQLGANTNLVWVLNCCGYHYEKCLEICTMQKNGIFIDEIDDYLSNVGWKKISRRRWIKDLFESNSFMYLDKHDINPYLFMVINKILPKLIKLPIRIWHKITRKR